MEIVLTEHQLTRVTSLLECKNIKNHEKHGLQMLLGLHQKMSAPAVAQEIGVSGAAVDKRCRTILKGGVESFLDKLECRNQCIERFDKARPGENIASFAKELGISERRVRYLRERNQVPSLNGAVQTLNDLFQTVAGKSEPVMDLAGVSIIAHRAIAVLAVSEPTGNHVHYRKFLAHEPCRDVSWTELSTKDLQFAKVFCRLREIESAQTIPPARGHSEELISLVSKVRRQFPSPYCFVVIVGSKIEAEQLECLAGRGNRISVHCCNCAVIDWVERLFYSMRIKRSSVGLAPNIRALHATLDHSSNMEQFEWTGSAVNANEVIQNRIVSRLFHAAQGHVHELSSWLWHQMPRANTVPLITFRWHSKVQTLRSAVPLGASDARENTAPTETLVSIAPLPGIAYHLWLSADVATNLRAHLREKGPTKHFYLTNGLDCNESVRPHHVFCTEHELNMSIGEPSAAMQNEEDDANAHITAPGSATTLVTRHLIFPPPPGELSAIESLTTNLQVPIARQMVSTAEGPQDCLIFSCPSLLEGIMDAFFSEKYADLIIEATSWEEQSVYNLHQSGTEGSEAFFEAMTQINERLPILRPEESDSATDQHWQELFYNCDADFLVSGISTERKREIEEQLGQWSEKVMAVIAESKPLFKHQGAKNDYFQETVLAFSKAQRRVVRRAVETCNRLAIAGLPPVAIAVVPVKEILNQFARELWSRTRARRSGISTGPSATVVEELTKAPSNGEAWDLANLLADASRMLDNPDQEEDF